MVYKKLACVFFLVILQISKCRRYDIELEAQNLYNSDLKSVVERFRRTPEYLKILEDEIELLNNDRNRMTERLSYYYNKRLLEKIVEMFGGNGTLALRSIGHPPVKRVHKKRRRRISRKGNKRTSKYLDKYKKFRMLLTLEQRNRMKQLGFEYAGAVIHGLVKHSIPDNVAPISTLLPYDGDSVVSSTIVHHDHVITQSTQTETQTETTFEYTEATEHHHTHPPEFNDKKH